MNTGQMLMWHIVLIPIILIALIGAHVLLVRVRGVSHPLPVDRLRGRAARRAGRAADAAPWHGPTRRYDILKEGSIAAVVVLILTVGLASLLSSPDTPSITVASWVQAAPADFLATAATELNATSETATYGLPYNTNGTPQKILFAPGQHHRRPAADQRGADVRALSAIQARPDRPRPGHRAGHLQRRVRGPAEQVGD